MKYVVINSIHHVCDADTGIYNIGVTENANEATELMLQDYKNTLENLLYTEEQIEIKMTVQKDAGTLTATEAEFNYNDEEYYKWQILQI